MKQSNERIVTIADGDDYKRQAKSGSSAIRLKQQTRDDLDLVLTKVNTKELGKKLHPDDVIDYALKLVKDEHISRIRDSSLSNEDRLEIIFRQHQRKKRSLTKDDFVGMLLDGKLNPGELKMRLFIGPGLRLRIFFVEK